MYISVYLPVAYCGIFCVLGFTFEGIGKESGFDWAIGISLSINLVSASSIDPASIMDRKELIELD